MSIVRMQRALLLALGFGLTPIALSYGAIPHASLPWLFGIDATDIPTRHLFRAIMGLYLALICFWIVGARQDTLRRPALWSLFVFTFGLALGRCLSLILDGWPGLLLTGYMIAEVALALTAGWLLWREPQGALPPSP